MYGVYQRWLPLDYEDPVSTSNQAMNKKKRKGEQLEAPTNKKQKTKEKLVVKSNTQCIAAIEKKKNFELYQSYQRIDLSNCLIGPVGSRLLGDALKSAQIVELCLAGNHLPSRSISPVLASLQNLTILESLDLAENKLSDVDAKLIWTFMATSQTLTKLDISCNEISLEGEWVSGPLKRSKICHLILSDNPIGDKGVSYIAVGLMENNHLESLDLQDTDVTGLTDISSLLRSNTTLTRLDLSGNSLSNDYVQLCEALRVNKALVELNLQSVGLSLSSFAGFIDVLRENTILRFMRIAKNELPAELVKAFRQLLSTRRELRVTNNLANDAEISYNDFTADEEAEVEEQKEEDACKSNLCSWPNYERLSSTPRLEEAAEIIALYPEVHIGVIVKKELDTHTMKQFYDTAVNKLSAALSALEHESHTKGMELSNLARPLQDKERALTQLIEKKQKLELQIQRMRLECDQDQMEYLKKKIPVMLTEDILNSAKINADLLSKRQSATCAQFEAHRAKMQQPLIEWSADDVAMLLGELNIGQYCDKFTSNAVTGGVLVNLNTSDLMQDLGMDWKDAKKLQKALFLLNNQRTIYDNPPGVFHWSTDDTCQWLVSAGFEKYIEVFKKHKVTGQELLLIDKYDLSNVFKIESLVDKVALERVIKSLVLEDDPSWKKDPSVVIIKQQPVKQEKQEPKI